MLNPDTVEELIKDFTNINNITSIGSGAFRETGITKFNIPSQLITLDNTVFDKCSSLTEVNFNSLNNLTEIGTRTFGNCNFSSITLPNSLIRIREQAFKNCVQLQEIIIPDNVTIIEKNAFETRI